MLAISLLACVPNSMILMRVGNTQGSFYQHLPFIFYGGGKRRGGLCLRKVYVGVVVE
jgi:hypothetical protein